MAGDPRLGKALRTLREAQGISLKAAAGALLGTERHATIAEIEAGKRGVSFAEMVRLAEIYGVTLADVLSHASEEAKPLPVTVALPRTAGELGDEDRMALARMERAARDYAALKAVLEG